MQMRHPGRTLVFVNAISMTLRVSKILTQLCVPTIALHAGQQQRQRLKVRTPPPPLPPALWPFALLRLGPAPHLSVSSKPQACW